MGCRAALAVMLLALPARAVVVRGRVTDPLGRPLPGARVQLIRGPKNLADAITGADGTYEIRSAASGRFLLLTSSSIRARYPAVQIGAPFYAGRTDIVEQDVFLDPEYLTPQVSSRPTLVPTPLPELADLPSQISADELLSSARPLFRLRLFPSAFMVEQGTTGTPAEIYVRGAGPQTVKIQIAGVAAEDLGGGFNLAILSSTGLAGVDPATAVELDPGSLPLAGIDAEGGLLSVATIAARESRPSLTVVGDAGNLSTLRGEADGAITHQRADLRGGFSRFDTDSGSPALGFHLASADLNGGYNISAGTSLRLLARREVSGAPLALPLAIFRAQPNGEDSAQNLYASLAFDTVTAKQWHNRVVYGLARKRRQIRVESLPATLSEVTLTGAHGTTVTGTPAFPLFPRREDRVTDRDVGTYATDYPISHNHSVAAEVKYVDERAADLLPGTASRFNLRHVDIAIGASGNLLSARLHHRLFYEASALADDSSSIGWLEAPRAGVTFVPVFAGTRRFRGTTLHATAASSFGESSTAALVFLQANAARESSPRSRTFSFAADQVLLPQKLTLRATYFHGQYSHQDEALAFHSISPTLGYRAQGLELGLHYQPYPRLFLAGGYTYLAALVEQSAQAAAFNPALPGRPIGALGALTGSRPFNRPPQTGWVSLHYTGTRLSAALDGNFAGRSDASSGLAFSNDLLLPNRDLSPGYADLNANVLYRLGAHVAVFTQLDNLLDDRRIAPFGFQSTPFLIRTGLRLRLGGD